ncbi:hypothetical protein ABZN20_07735 [Methylococcus sp. ANG]
MQRLTGNLRIADDNKHMPFAATDVFLPINGWSLKRPPMQI